MGKQNDKPKTPVIPQVPPKNVPLTPKQSPPQRGMPRRPTVKPPPPKK